MIALKTPTDARWLPLALTHFNQVLVDHAHCEKKAAANALSLLQAYPDVPGLPLQMARLAREESAHLAKVLHLLQERGLALEKDRGDPYVQKLQKVIRTAPLERRLDRLLVASIIEARSAERLGLLAEGLSEPGLKRFYQELAQSERGHEVLFFRLAAGAHGHSPAEERLEALLEWEAEVLIEVGIRPAIH